MLTDLASPALVNVPATKALFYQAIQERISLEMRVCATSFWWPTWLKQHLAVTWPVENSVLAVMNAGQEHAVLVHAFLSSLFGSHLLQ